MLRRPLFFVLMIVTLATTVWAEPRKPAAEVYAGAADDGSVVRLEVSGGKIQAISFARAATSRSR